MAFIAYRVPDPKGDKTDKEGNKFFGWEDTFDEWITLYAPIIAPYQKFSDPNLQKQSAEAQNAVPDDTLVDDSLDEELGKDLNIFAVQRTCCKSDLLINFLNHFGSYGGFEKMLEMVKSILNKENKVPFNDALRLLSTFCECIGKVAPVLFRPFALKFIP
jgi:hypothetical protein